MTTYPTSSGCPLAAAYPAAAVEHRINSSGGPAAQANDPRTCAATSIPAHASPT